MESDPDSNRPHPCWYNLSERYWGCRENGDGLSNKGAKIDNCWEFVLIKIVDFFPTISNYF